MSPPTTIEMQHGTDGIRNLSLDDPLVGQFLDRFGLEDDMLPQAPYWRAQVSDGRITAVVQGSRWREVPRTVVESMGRDAARFGRRERPFTVYDVRVVPDVPIAQVRLFHDALAYARVHGERSVLLHAPDSSIMKGWENAYRELPSQREPPETFLDRADFWMLYNI